ncbi:MAG: TrkA C-terminal domain-containing protein, partial [Chitinophagaceae bacterium]|nr:TrkA C-terminal domain-containing protein [Chitinophagaceae bacterium]
TINILSIERAGVYIVPNGSTKLMGGDILHVLAEDENALELLSATLGIG